MKLQDCTALITGASAGIGRELARALASRARKMVLTARRADRLEELRAELIAKNPYLSVECRAIDLRERQEIEELCDGLEREKIAIDFLINNAGLGDQGKIATSDATRDLEMIDVNVAALTLLTRRLLPAMLEKKRGAILNVASIASFQPLPRMAIYAATKAYVRSFSEALRMEVGGRGISVTTLCPGPVETEFSEVANRKGGPLQQAPAFLYVSAEAVARAGLKAIEANRALVIPGAIPTLGMFFAGLIPIPLFRLVARFF